LKADIVARGVPEHRITVIPNAVDENEFRFGVPVDKTLKQALGLVGATVIGFVGSFYAYEGLDLLIEALPRILRSRQDARILLVGGGPQESMLRELTRASGVADKVIFTGRVPHRDVQRYYGLVDVFVYPRRSMRLTELVTPLKPLEAMAQGHLLIASDVGGHRELIRDGRTGFLFPAGNRDALAETLLRVLDASDRWPTIRAQGRAFVEEERSWKKSAAGYVAPFTRLAASTMVALEAIP
jgi:PEP-CTERM/exosortase A-associated glycosyltransferase